MPDLAAFLLARIAEDEEVANRARIYGWPGSGAKTVVDQVARWSPARVLAECEAKRRIVENARVARRAMGEAPLEQLLSAQDGPAAAYWRGLDYALRLLALPYADHGDYRERWRP